MKVKVAPLIVEEKRGLSEGVQPLSKLKIKKRNKPRNIVALCCGDVAQVIIERG